MRGQVTSGSGDRNNKDDPGRPLVQSIGRTATAKRIPTCSRPTGPPKSTSQDLAPTEPIGEISSAFGGLAVSVAPDRRQQEKSSPHQKGGDYDPHANLDQD